MNNNEERNKLLEVQSWLAEYEALQNERLGNHRYKQILIEINIIALGVIIGLVVTADIYPYALILTMSLICSCLGLLWIGEDRKSLTCSNYIINTIAPALHRLIGSPEIVKAESYKYREFYERLHSRGRVPSLEELPGAIIEFLIFLVPSVAGIIIGIYGLFSSPPWYCWALLAGAIILTNALAVTGRRWYKEWHARSPQETPSDANL